MKKLYSVKIILKYKTSRTIYEENVLLIRMEEGDKISRQCEAYVQLIKDDLQDESFVELDEIVDFCELNDTFAEDFQYKEIYSSFIVPA